MWISTALLTLAVSLDSFAVGAAYGFRRMEVGPATVLAISLISAAAKGVAMMFGSALLQWFTPLLARRAGAGVLAALGLWQLAVLAPREPEGSGDETFAGSQGADGLEAGTMFVFRLRFLGLVIKVLRDPQLADIDASRHIGAPEAMLLGLACGLDALGAGVGAGLLGLSVAPTAAAVGLGTLVSLPAGMKAGEVAERDLTGRPVRVLPGVLLLLLAAITWFG